MDCEICTRQLSFIEYERSLRLGFREGVCGGCLEVEVWCEDPEIDAWLKSSYRAAVSTLEWMLGFFTESRAFFGGAQR